MTDLKPQDLEKELDTLLNLTGSESLVDWQSFSKNSNDVSVLLESVGKKCAILRYQQQKSFITKLKKLKSLDTADVLKDVKSKKLPSQALKTILPRFKKTEDGKIELVESIDSLKKYAKEIEEPFNQRNEQLLKILRDTNEALYKLMDSKDLEEERPELPGLKFTFDKSRVAELAKAIQIQYLPSTDNLIGIKTYMELIDASVELVTEQFIQLTKESRRKQRYLFKDPTAYLQVATYYIINSEGLVVQGQAAIAEKMGISAKKIENSEEVMADRGLAGHMIQAQNYARAKLKYCMKPNKDCTLDEIKKVIEFQIKVLKDKSKEVREYLKGLPKSVDSVHLVPGVLNVLLADYVFQEFGYEEEDFIKNLSPYAMMTNQELAVLFQEMELAVIALVRSLELLPEEMYNYMEESAKNPGPMGYLAPGMVPPQLPSNIQPGMIPPGMMPPGVMPPAQMPPGIFPPGTDPMAMLQFQQMQAQMSAMNKGGEKKKKDK